MHEVHAQIYMKRYTKMYIIVNKRDKIQFYTMEKK